jgi:ABC-2 type transport system permease protein
MSKLSESSLFQLTSARFRLFFREPEAVFWIFVFPILLSVGLSIAFRNRPADVLQVAGTTSQLTQWLNADKGLSATTLSEEDGRKALATGKILVLAVQGSNGVVFDYDNTNPDAPIARWRKRRDSATVSRSPVSKCMSRGHAISTSWCPGF